MNQKLSSLVSKLKGILLGIFVISFTDGDGDIGLDIGDTLTPFEPRFLLLL